VKNPCAQFGKFWSVSVLLIAVLEALVVVTALQVQPD